MRIRFDGKTVVVSGAGHGFGRCITETFAQLGARVFGCDLSAAELAETAKAGVQTEIRWSKNGTAVPAVARGGPTPTSERSESPCDAGPRSCAPWRVASRASRPPASPQVLTNARQRQKGTPARARWTPETLMPEKRTRSADQRQQYQPKDE